MVVVQRYQFSNLIEPIIQKRENTVFDEIRSGWVKTFPKSAYAQDGAGYWRLEPFENYYYFLEKCCTDKKITIMNPFTGLPISTDIYFTTTINEGSDSYLYGNPTLICNYCFMEENIILGMSCGTAYQSMFSGSLYLIDFNQNVFLTLSHCDYPYYYSFEYLSKLLDFKNQLNREMFDSMESKTKIVIGYVGTPVHLFFNEFTGIYILNKMNFENKIDEIIIGPYNLYNTDLILKEKNHNILINKKENLFELDFCIGRGIFFAYCHFYITNQCSLFFKEKIDKYSPITVDTQMDIDYIKNTYNPIFTIHLRCGVNGMVNQEVVVSETINALQKEYPRSFFLLDGFFGSDNVDSELCLTLHNDKYFDLLTEYKTVVEKIKSKIKEESCRSLIDLRINHSLKYSEISNFGIYFNSTYQVILWSCNVPGIFPGRAIVDHFRSLDVVIKEDVEEVDYFVEGVSFFKENEKEVFSVDSSTIVHRVINNLNRLKII